jgi:Glycosyltransferase family 92
VAAERWTAFIEWARRARAKPTFDAEEREYRLAIAVAIRGLFEAAREGGTLRAKLRTVVERVMKTQFPVTPYPQLQHLVDWAERDEPSFADALRSFAAAGEDPCARLATFVEAIERGPGADRFAGGGLVVASLLNFGLSPERCPVVHPGRYARLQKLLGESREPFGSPAEEYGRWIAFSHRIETALREAGVAVRDMIDVESLITISSIEHELWTDDGQELDFARASEPDVYLAMCTLFRNEAHHIGEWIEFHMLVGVERFFLYDNESDDDPRDVLSPYIEEGIVVLHEWPGSGGEDNLKVNNLQRTAYEHCLSVHGEEARWIAFTDSDEFLFSPTRRSVAELLVEYERWPAVVVNLVFFGTSGHVTRPRGLVIENYTNVLEMEAGGRGALVVKSIVDPAAVKRCRGANAFEYRRGAAVDENGYPAFSVKTKSRSVERLRINHYFARSEDDLRAKLARRTTPYGYPEALRPEHASGVRDDAISGYLEPLREALARRAARGPSVPVDRSTVNRRL